MLTRTFSGPQPRPSRISIVIDRETTSRDARSFADGAYLRSARAIAWMPVFGSPNLIAHELAALHTAALLEGSPLPFGIRRSSRNTHWGVAA